MRLRRKRNLFNVPVSSMSDVAFLLLIFIMLMALINFRREVRIEFPQVANAKKVSSDKNLEIWVDLAGNLYLDGVLTDINGIQNGIIEAYKISEETRVHILADRGVSFAYVQQVLEVLQILQHRTVSFVVKDP